MQVRLGPAARMQLQPMPGRTSSWAIALNTCGAAAEAAIAQTATSRGTPVRTHARAGMGVGVEVARPVLRPAAIAAIHYAGYGRGAHLGAPSLKSGRLWARGRSRAARPLRTTNTGAAGTRWLGQRGAVVRRASTSRIESSVLLPAPACDMVNVELPQL
jgi:hypothetical protein